MPELSSRFDPRSIEEPLYAGWEAAGAFTAHPEAPGEAFSIVIPPPNVTGVLHVGHALNNSLQDILARWRRMQGRNVLWLPGTDHAGIATQHVVERRLREQGIDPRALGREEFLRRVWRWKEQHGSTIIRQLKALGCSCDWTRERFTMDEGLSRAVRLVFKALYDEGLIYRGVYLINWSPKLQTALSDDEVEYRQVEGHLWYLRYPLADGPGHAVVATTRPETMLGDAAVAVHPDDERYRGLIGRTCILPLLGRPIPIIADPLVSRAFGTGMVKVTPAHDPNDYEIGRRHGLPFINILNPDGTLNAEAGPYAGLEVAEARRGVLADLEAAGLIDKIEPHVHSVGHCYRSGCVVEPYVSRQWFVRMQPLAEPAIRAVQDGRTRFVPAVWEKNYFHWLENVRDWCISRQLWWGHRIPVWTCQDCGAVACLAEGEPERCSVCGGQRLTQDPDVLDTWFSSALWPFSTMGWPEATPTLRRYYPTSVLVTAHDIIFFWVARMMMMGLKFMGEVPFREVYITPLILAEGGGKMSKSKGNALDPVALIEPHGADAVRLTLAGHAPQSRTVSLSMQRFEASRNFTNKLWNAARFTLMNVEDLTAPALAGGIDRADLALEDRWLLAELRGAAERADGALEAYEFDRYVAALYDFAWRDFCDWYVELVKPRLRPPKAGDRSAQASRRAAQIVLVTALEGLLRLLHPVAPFLTEAIWRLLRERWGPAAAARLTSLAASSLMVAPWPEPSGWGDSDPEARAQMRLLQQVVYLIRKVRGELGVPPALPTEVEVLIADDEQRSRLERLQPYISTLVPLAALRIAAESALPGVAASAVAEGATVQIPLSPALREAERQRLDREIDRLRANVERLAGKLDDHEFIRRAPAEVIQRERARLAGDEAKLEQLRRRLELLAR